jgi:hypothetical protein
MGAASLLFPPVQVSMYARIHCGQLGFPFYQVLAQHINGRAGFSQGLLRQGLRLSCDAAPPGTADLGLTHFSLPQLPLRLASGWKRSLIIGQSLHLCGRGEEAVKPRSVVLARVVAPTAALLFLGEGEV